MKTITTKWLIDNRACVEGVNWFRRNYPNGLKITKKNITELFNRLSKRRKAFAPYSVLGQLDVCIQMEFVLYSFKNKKDTNFGAQHILEDENPKDLINAWWEEYKAIK